MKEHKIDLLFRQKLNQHSVAPTPTAWDKLDADLSSKRRRRGGYYYAAAAAVALLLSFGWLWIGQRPEPLSPQQTPAVAMQEAPAVKQHNDGPGVSDATAPTPVTEAEKAIGSEASDTQPTRGMAVAETSKAQAVKQQRTQPQQAVTPLPLAEPDAPTETALATATPQQPVLEATPLEVRPIAIEPQPAEELLAQAEQVVIRYDASLSQAVASQEAIAAAEEEAQGAEKVLSILQKVKQGEIGLADIRQAKNKLLSGRINKP